MRPRWHRPCWGLPLERRQSSPSWSRTCSASTTIRSRPKRGCRNRPRKDRLPQVMPRGAWLPGSDKPGIISVCAGRSCGAMSTAPLPRFVGVEKRDQSLRRRTTAAMPLCADAVKIAPLSGRLMPCRPADTPSTARCDAAPREIVEGLRLNRQAISRTPSSWACQMAMSSRSENDK